MFSSKTIKKKLFLRLISYLYAFSN